MKKISAVCLLLSLLLLVSWLPVPAAADETEPSATEAVTEVPTEPPYEGTVPTVEFGTATVANGCRTIEAQVPLGGSIRFLESSQSAMIYETKTGTMVYSYNPDRTLYPGSLSKVMTAVIAIEEKGLDDKVTVSTRNYKTLPPGALNAKLKEGEILTLRDLLYCMYMTNANDAAISIAEYVAGSEAEFVVKMNRKAEELGCRDTVFVNCHGMDVPNQHTTARDMVRIMTYAIKNETFRELSGATSYKVPETERSNARSLKSLNYLIEETIVPKFNNKRVTGGMTSYADASGASLICTAEEKGLSYVCVVMGAQRQYNENGTVKNYGNFEEMLELLKYGFDNFKYRQILYDGQALNQFPVIGGQNEVVGQPKISMDAVLPADATMNTLIWKYNVANGSLAAPIQKNQVIAELQIWYQTSCLAETEIYAMSGVRAVEDGSLDIQNGALRDDSNLKEILSFIGILCLIVLVPAVLYFVVLFVRRARAIRRHRRRSSGRRRSR